MNKTITKPQRKKRENCVLDASPIGDDVSTSSDSGADEGGAERHFGGLRKGRKRPQVGGGAGTGGERHAQDDADRLPAARPDTGGSHSGRLRLSYADYICSEVHLIE